MLNLKKQNKNSESYLSAITESALSAAKSEPFADIPAGAEEHFELFFLAAAAFLLRRLERNYGSREAVFGEFSFLRNYDDQLAGREPDELADEDAADWWKENLSAWEKNVFVRLPLRDLREKFALGFSAVIRFITIGLVEEDARFGAVFEYLNESSEEKRLTFGTYNDWRREENQGASAHSELYKLENLGLLHFGGTENPRSEWTLQVNTMPWDILRGEEDFRPPDRLKFVGAEHLPAADALILPDALRGQLNALPKLFERGDINCVVVRGANRNSRKTILDALAKSLGLGVLEVKMPEIKTAENWKILEISAILLRAMPIFRLDAAPSETIDLPAFSPSVKAFGITLGKQGGISDETVENAVTLTVNLPDEAERRAHWLDCYHESEIDEIDEISRRFRLSSGNLRRAAKLAKSYAALANRSQIKISDVQQAARTLNRQSLDTLATYLEPLDANWSFLAVRDETSSDLRQLEERCRIRENLKKFIGAGLRGQLQPGVRALFNGGSGTGKTYAARLLAAAAQKDIYRLDLSTIVNKYIGETEKNLARVFSLIEELDVILLLDEGDALLTQRTSVTSANDRYANLETNYLLQRLESFEGVLIVTTNSGERIDSAFQRRMDTVIEFASPSAAERRHIWHLHLPENNDVRAEFLEEIIQRCELTGGQIRNVTLHAASLALGEKSSLNSRLLESAVRREYRKIGAICPLRRDSEASFNTDRW